MTIYTDVNLKYVPEYDETIINVRGAISDDNVEVYKTYESCVVHGSGENEGTIKILEGIVVKRLMKRYLK